jgi:hypothetical protein
MILSNETYDTIVDALETELANVVDLADFYESTADDITPADREIDREIIETLRFSAAQYQSALDEFQDKARNWRSTTP